MAPYAFFIQLQPSYIINIDTSGILQSVSLGALPVKYGLPHECC